MVGLPSMIFLDIGDEQWMGEVGWPLLFVVFLLVANLYAWSYISRNIEKIRSAEGRFMDRELVNYLEKMIKTLILIFSVFLIIYSISLVWEDFRENVWEPSLQYFVDIAIIIMVFMVAVLLVQILRRAALSRGRQTDPEGASVRGTAQVILLIIGYLIYVGAAMISLVIIVSALYPDMDLFKEIGTFLSDHGNVLVSVIAIFIAIHFATKLIDEILEDYKFKTKKFNPQVIDLFKRSAKYVLWAIALMTVMYSIFAMFNLQDIGFLLIGLFIVLLLVASFISYHALRNISCGMALMGPSIYDLNERIVIDGTLEGDVVQKNLMFTELKLLDGTFVNVPNTKMIDSEIFNVSRSGGKDICVSIAMSFSTPHSEVEGLIEKALEKVGGLSKDIPPLIMVTDIDGDKMVYKVKVHTDDISIADKVRSDLLICIQEAFHQAGFEDLY
ncbi:MAG: mechanosensitive ion channel family protein [Methanomassiliicoccales archaeon]|nr:MAG: mechanosensitive ion channel family protein [Methanomassiliicoccales archaeon]